MKKFIRIMLICIFISCVFAPLAWAAPEEVREPGAEDITNYKTAFAVMNNIPFDITLEQTYILYNLASDAVSTPVIDSIIAKMEATINLHLSLKEIYTVRKLVEAAPDSAPILDLRTFTTQVIIDFKDKLLKMKTETEDHVNTITTIEDVITTEETP